MLIKKEIIQVRNILSFVIFLGMFFSTSPEVFAQNNALISLDSTKQVIRGFGAANIVNWRGDMTEDEITTAFSIGDESLGFSILRLRIPPYQDEWDDYVPTAKAAFDMGATIIASPWTPPSEMKTDLPDENQGAIGGRLADDMYDDYARHLKAYVDFMAENGIPIYAVSVQNEPDIAVNYESCDWTPEEMTRFVREYGDSVGTKLIAPESFQFRRPISDAILNDPQATASLDIIGGHIYGGGLAPYPLAEEKGKEIWMTEHLDTDISWNAVLATGKEIHDVMAAGMNAYIWWYIVRFYGPIHDGEDWNEDDIVDDGEKGDITKRGYIMSQYSRFVRPGYFRIEVNENPQSDLFISAYKDTSTVDTAKTVIVAVNTGSREIEQSFTLDGGSIKSFKQYVTTETSNTEQLEAIGVQASTGTFSVTLAPESVTTFVSDTTHVPVEVNLEGVLGYYDASTYISIGSLDQPIDVIEGGGKLFLVLKDDFSANGYLTVPDSINASAGISDTTFSGSFSVAHDTLRFQNTGTILDHEQIPYIITKDQLESIDLDGFMRPFKVILVKADSMSISIDESIDSKTRPQEYHLKQNYPNPFNPSTTISFVIPKAGNVSLKIYDLLGQEISTLIEGRLQTGTHEFQFDATHLSSGIYIYQLKVNDFTETRRMTLIK